MISVGRSIMATMSCSCQFAGFFLGVIEVCAEFELSPVFVTSLTMAM